MDGRQSQGGFKRRHLRIFDAAGPADPAQTFFGYLERCLTGKDSADCRQGGCVEAGIGFFVELAFGHECGATSQAAAHSA